MPGLCLPSGGILGSLTDFGNNFYPGSFASQSASQIAKETNESNVKLKDYKLNSEISESMELL